ncbi:pyridoxal phosphate-dependent aminotransferase [Arthrobacter sp. SDTb3-6]|uniref:pyridoxal phosphate-dependent aminotransferase n=1 Tax=Arthrobacter sp. SDTb3-6 TaxID=2713571 RepID=UPI00159DD249|nr:aminotransferase class I/II-fold pyridoxal phosphate-dependent enzyme [Arthrobacter sp. SDTb3-6]NVN00054.1 aminotransferase class I/II-fold pyridoxal phosphate-dependent enzyme [Arthrobacter sp. SDTb3-6]
MPSPKTIHAIQRVRDVSLRKPLPTPPPGVVSLAVGEPDFDTPKIIRDAMKDALNRGETHYSNQLGLISLREAIALQERRIHNPLTLDDVLVTHGGTAGLAAAILGLVQPGDVVAIEDPTYSLYRDLVAYAGGTVKSFTRDRTGRLEPESLAEAVSDAKLVIVCQPSNPTGAIMNDADWMAIESATVDQQTTILSDEAYANLVYDDLAFISILDRVNLAGRGILCQTFSKKFAMTGWRVGYLVGPPSTISSAATVHRTFNGSVNTAVQYAALTALTEGQAAANGMLETYAERRIRMELVLNDTDGLRATRPEGAFYYFCKYADSRPSVEVARAAAEAGVLVRPGREFGPAGEGFVRLSFAVGLDDIHEGIARLGGILKLDGKH